MDEETVYAVGNPSYAKHIQRILKYPVVPSLSENAELREHGVSRVGAGYSTWGITLHPTLVDSTERTIAIPMYELQKKDVRSESELIEFCKSAILEALNKPQNV